MCRKGAAEHFANSVPLHPRPVRSEDITPKVPSDIKEPLLLVSD